MKRALTTFICIWVFTTLNVFAQSDSTTKRFSITPLPIIVSDPFMGLGFGALANANFLTGNVHSTRYSNAQVYAMKTTNGQLAAQINHTIFTNNEKYFIQGKIQYLDWPENVFALGGNTSRENDIERISYKALEFEERIMRKFGKNNFIGVQYRLYNFWNISSNQVDSISFYSKNATGKQSFTSSSIGLHFIHDSRDNVQNAFKGNYAEVAINPNLKELGSTQYWTNIRVDLRTYKMLNSNLQHPQILAARVLYEQAIGDVPYMLMPMFGRYYTTRGYVQGRYRGNSFVSSELEYRAHIWKAIGGVMFAGAHAVSETDGTYQYINPTAGAGVRIMLNKSQRTNLRVDYAIGKQNEGGLYLQVTEAF